MPGNGLVVASAYPFEKVTGSRPGRVLKRTLKTVPTAALFDVEHRSI
jgi:hypothetical protein